MEIILGIIDQVIGNKLIIRTNDNQQLIIPINSNNWKEGQALKIIILDNAKAGAENQSLAKQILNNILQGVE